MYYIALDWNSTIILEKKKLQKIKKQIPTLNKVWLSSFYLAEIPSMNKATYKVRFAAQKYIFNNSFNTNIVCGANFKEYHAIQD